MRRPMRRSLLVLLAAAPALWAQPDAGAASGPVGELLGLSALESPAATPRGDAERPIVEPLQPLLEFDGPRRLSDLALSAFGKVLMLADGAIEGARGLDTGPGVEFGVLRFTVRARFQRARTQAGVMRDTLASLAAHLRDLDATLATAAGAWSAAARELAAGQVELAELGALYAMLVDLGTGWRLSYDSVLPFDAEVTPLLEPDDHRPIALQGVGASAAAGRPDSLGTVVARGLTATRSAAKLLRILTSSGADGTSPEIVFAALDDYLVARATATEVTRGILGALAARQAVAGALAASPDLAPPSTLMEDWRDLVGESDLLMQRAGGHRLLHAGSLVRRSLVPVFPAPLEEFRSRHLRAWR